MQKSTAISIVAAALLCAGQATATVVNVRPLGENKPARITPSTTVADVIINEDFSKMSGTNPSSISAQPADLDNGDGIIPSEYTHTPGWTASPLSAGEADGAILLFNNDPQSHSFLSTPYGDYSGEITLRFLVKAVETEIPEQGILTGTTLYVAPCVGEEWAETDADTYDSIRLYPEQGWCEVTMTFNNYSTGADGTIQFSCSGSILLDDVRITSANSEFIGAPCMHPVTDVCEDGFTISWDPVRKSFNYYVFLYTKKDDGTYYPMLDPELVAEYEEYGMTYDEILEEFPEEYQNWAITYDTSYTFKGLDPEKEYYYAVASHYVYLFSERQILHADVVAAPALAEASDITASSFTANWKPAPKATAYEVNLYSVTVANEDDNLFPLLQEDFSGINEFTDATSINDYDWLSDIDGFEFDMVTQNPGWSSDFGTESMIMIKDMLGFDANYWYNALITPELDCAGCDEITVDLIVASEWVGYPVILGFGEETKQIIVESPDDVMDITIPTHGMATGRLHIMSSGAPVFFDDINVYRSVKAGDRVMTYVSQTTVPAESTSLTFTDLDAEYEYAYVVNSLKGEGADAVRSTSSQKVIVNLKEGNSQTLAVDDIELNGAEEVARYTIDGMQVNTPVKGINIVRYSNGQTRKVFVK